jgi:hypothetical protein
MQKKDKKPVKNASDQQNENILAAENAAEHDIEMDPDLSMQPEPGDDLDEGELAKFESEDNN